MTLKIPKEYLILGGVIVALVLVLVLVSLSKSCTGQSLPTIAKIKKDDITKIVFTSSANGELTVEKDKEGKWRMIPQQYPVDKNSIDSMIANVADVTINALISDKKAYERYNLDDANKIAVSAFAGDKLARQYDIGKPSETSSFTFIKLADNPNIYSAKGNIRTVFDKKVDDMRDKLVMNFAKETITAFILETGGKTITIRQELNKIDPAATPEAGAQAPAAVWKTDLSDKPVSDTVINELFDGMINLTCDTFVEGKTKQELSTQPFSYRVTARGAKDYVVTYVDSGVENQYTGLSSESDYPFKVASWKATKLTRKIENGEIK
jgi:hypothetical protein